MAMLQSQKRLSQAHLHIKACRLYKVAPRLSSLNQQAGEHTHLHFMSRDQRQQVSKQCLYQHACGHAGMPVVCLQKAASPSQHAVVPAARKPLQ